MRYRISQIKINPLSVAADGGGIDHDRLMAELDRAVRKKVRHVIRAPHEDVRNLTILRESVDARKKPDVRLVYTVDFDWDGKLPFDEAVTEEYSIEKPISEENPRPVIAGFGPCGIFAGLVLAEAGLKPIILERGKPVDERVTDVERFWETCRKKESESADSSGEDDVPVPEPESNVQFGEGGAGTFSDGKLTTGIKDVRIRKVLQEFVKAGAPEEILYRQKPHIGTDRLRKVVVALRRRIEELGGEVRFNAKLEDLVIEENGIRGIQLAGETEILETGALILAIGHSARDTFEMLYTKGFDMVQKPFSIGVRIEHPQEMINISQYGDPQLAEIIGPADYKLSYRCRGTDTGCMTGRGVYTFCMCPGGQVVNASTEPGTSVTNGMSNSARDGEYANAAVLVDVRPDDFSRACSKSSMPEDKPLPEDNPLAGFEFQRKYEKLAWENRTCGGMARTIYRDFRSLPDPVRSSIPDFASEAILEAMPHFGRKIHGFDRDDAVMTAVESRSSSPVRVLRDENLEAEISSTPVRGVIPAGEGPGYAGGIMSAAVDGIRAAEAVISRYAGKV